MAEQEIRQFFLTLAAKENVAAVHSKCNP
jgi:hypothetical protein